ncbi:MAG: GMC family oxidoreductase, partial [Myxococcales bacterium]|nr:GMC family oxidoreductase [Myxococcales bacterium]
MFFQRRPVASSADPGSVAATGDPHYDWVIIGSGFGGSVCALRLSAKGYRVLVIEQGRRFAPSDFPRTNWDVRRWMWMPSIGLRGLFRMSVFEHLTVLHGVGVGGGSLVYANTLPTPDDRFFTAEPWGKLADWRAELSPHYAEAKRMLGATSNPRETVADRVLRDVARDLGREGHVRSAEVGVYFGEPGRPAPDPYFGGEGPERTGCTFCGACMTGCRVGAKNTLDRNYLYLAEKRGARILAETRALAIRPRTSGYVVETRSRAGRRSFTADRVICAGGVMGTVPLLLRMREDPGGLPKLSPGVGQGIRTNSEALLGVVVPGRRDLADGIAITSLLKTDEHSHVEPVRYGRGSGIFRLLAVPHAPGRSAATRLLRAARAFTAQPRSWLQALTVADFASQSQILLYMRTLDSTLSFELGRGPWTAFRRGLVTRIERSAQPPQAFMQEATDLAERFARKVQGVPVSLLTEMVLGTPSTAH